MAAYSPCCMSCARRRVRRRSASMVSILSSPAAVAGGRGSKHGTKVSRSPPSRAMCGKPRSHVTHSGYCQPPAQLSPRASPAAAAGTIGAGTTGPSGGSAARSTSRSSASLPRDSSRCSHAAVAAPGRVGAALAAGSSRAASTSLSASSAALLKNGAKTGPPRARKRETLGSEAARGSRAARSSSAAGTQRPCGSELSGAAARLSLALGGANGAASCGWSGCSRESSAKKRGTERRARPHVLPSAFAAAQCGPAQWTSAWQPCSAAH
mmetsp:Transcript_33675/g.110114  ORF Transcript_33675/g.110114 Transcript_33675/m.110114 type:complete len:267 (+) Transcript_33675:284-1084(+)